MSRAKTAEEVRAEFIAILKTYAAYWASLPDKSPYERCDGMAFSMLALLDGSAMGFPAVDISLSPHPDDKAYCQTNGKNWHEHGMVINDCQLHELFYEKK